MTTEEVASVMQQTLAEIPLRRRDGTVAAYALVDIADEAWANGHKWHLIGSGYAGRAERLDSCQTRNFLLHRELLGLTTGDGLQGDHRNGDRLDNRRSNLRVVTKAQNMQNVRSYAGSSSRFRGVSWETSQGKWRVEVKVAGRPVWVGRFDDELDAARAAEAVRRTYLPYAERDAALS